MNRAREQFVVAPLSLVRDVGFLKAWDVRVYLGIRSYYSERKQTPVFPSRKTIAKNIGCSIDVVDRSIRRLIAAGHLFKESGHTGHSNRYQFSFRVSTDRTTELSPLVAGEPSDGGQDRDGMVAPQRSQPESNNHKNKAEKPPSLFHGGDRAFANSDGTIVILNHTGERVVYGGGDDERFRFGSLCGVEARMAAFTAASKETTRFRLPTSL